MKSAKKNSEVRDDCCCKRDAKLRALILDNVNDAPGIRNVDMRKRCGSQTTRLSVNGDHPVGPSGLVREVVF